jgi:hypothetical protein
MSHNVYYVKSRRRKNKASALPPGVDPRTILRELNQRQQPDGRRGHDIPAAA